MRKTLHILGIITIALTLSTVCLFAIHPRISLVPVYPILSSSIKALTNINTKLSGNIFLVPGLWTSLIIDDASLEIQTNNGLQTTATLSSGKVTFHLLSLLKRHIALDGLLVHGMSVSFILGDKQTDSDFGERTDIGLDDVVEFLEQLDFIEQTGPIKITDLVGSIVRPDKTSTFNLDIARGHLDLSSTGILTASGNFEDQQFTVNTEIGPLQKIKSLEPLPLSIHLSHQNINFGLKGQLYFPEETAHLTSSFSLSGENIGDLASTFGYQNIPPGTFSMDGTIALSDQKVVLTIEEFYPGTKNLAVTLSADGLSSGNTNYTVSIQGDEFNLDQITGLFQRPESVASKEEIREQRQSLLNKILIPDALSDLNLILEISLKKLTVLEREISDLEITSSMRQGIAPSSLLRATFENSTVHGNLSLNLASETPKVAVNITSTAWNIGKTLDSFNLSEGVAIYMENLISTFKTSGRSLDELLTNLEFAIHADDGIYGLQDRNTGAILEVAIDKASIIGLPGKETSVELRGTVKDQQIAITTTLDDQRGEPKETITSLPFKQTITIADTTLKFNGTFPLPYTMEGLVVQSSLSGKKLSDLNNLLRLDLPGVGPYTLTGVLKVTPEGYKLNKINAHVGSSILEGDLFFNTMNATPDLLVELNAKTIQLSDFISVNDLRNTNNPVPEKSPKPEPLNKHLTDQKILDSYNGKVSLEVSEVYSGDDFLGSGSINIVQEGGELKITPLEISLPEGNLSIYFSIKPHGGVRHYSLNTHIEGLNYGVVGHWFKPDTDVGGILDLHSSLTSTSQGYRDFMANASGYIDLAIKPEKIRSGVIDLWAVNLLSYLLPIINPANSSTVNCAAGQFDINKGILTERNILIDTTRIQVKGAVEVDFPKGQIEAILRPRPKRPQFYSLATPIKIKGKISDFKVGFAKGGLIGTVIRIMTSYIVVPIQWIILDKIPEDGTINCQQLVQPRQP